MSIVEIGDKYDETWAEEDWRSASEEAVAGLRLVLSDTYADAGDAELSDALAEVMGAMSPAEAFNFGSALNQIARGAGRALSDPNVAAFARSALPVAGGVLGTVYGGPVGAALGGQLGTIAANALPGPRPAPAPGVPAPPGPVTPGPGAPAGVVSMPGASPAAGGSTAAAQGLVLAGNPLMQHALASAAFGQHGQQQVAGIPVAQLLGMLSQVMGRAAAEADELLYLSGNQRGYESGDAEGEGADWSPDAAQELYTSIVDADNLDLAEAFDLEEMTS